MNTPRSALIRLASTLPTGSSDRRAILRLAAKSTPSDVYKAVEQALEVKIKNHGETLTSNEVSFSWVDGPGAIELRAETPTDAKKLKSILTKGGITSTLRGSDLTINTNDFWDKP